MEGHRVLVAAKGWTRYAMGVLVVVAAVALLALIPNSKHKTASPAQLRQFGPVCASSGHLVSVVHIGRATGANRTAVYRVHCSGGLTTEVAR